MFTNLPSPRLSLSLEEQEKLSSSQPCDVSKTDNEHFHHTKDFPFQVITICSVNYLDRKC